MRFAERMLIGLVLILIGVAMLWYGSPARTGADEPILIMAWGFVLFFAIGFIIGSVGLLGAEDDYPAFVSGFVLYFILGGLVAVFLYVSRSDIGAWTLYDADNPRFWMFWSRVVATWPLELIRKAGILGYQLMS